MSETRELLVEIGTEELPPKALKRLSQAFADGMAKQLQEAGLGFQSIQTAAAPRRLALTVRALEVCQPDRETVRRGPALTAAFDEEGCPTQAALGFAKSCGVAVEELDQLETARGSWLSFRKLDKGRDTRELVPGMVEAALAGLPIPKRMRWGAGEAEFVRPVHWVVLLFGDQAVPGRVLGIEAGRATRGHRFHHPGPIELAHARDYLDVLREQGKVLADYRARRETIREQVTGAGVALGGQALIDEDLLDEVCSLVEWPVALSGRFEERFLEVPAEALISSMQDHQKYFPLVNDEGRLLPHFITVANVESLDPDQIRAGNERVIRPRLADAAFFWEQDRKQPLASRREGLKKMVFQKRLGSLADKQDRLARLAVCIAREIGGDTAHAERAATLCKCDLLTSMVYEFPELQGIMGRYYALSDGEPEDVATAIEEHYRPAFAGDALPATTTGRALALADRLDSLVGIFAIGQPPTGDKDPFALRRAALGLVRICIEAGLDLDLAHLLDETARGFPCEIGAENATGAVFDYVMDRLSGYYQEAAVAGDLVDAVLATRPTRLLDIDRRIRACQAFRELPEAEALAAANKRIGNILKKAGETMPDRVEPERLKEPAEQALAAALDDLRPGVLTKMDEGDYESALKILAGLREPVDAFFDQVMVMDEDPELRANRLALLASMAALFLRVADLSRLQQTA